MLWVVGVVLTIVLLFILGHFTTSTKPIKTITNPNALPGIITNKGPWNANTTNLSARLKAIGMFPSGSRATEMHIHEHLDISINGKHVQVPADIGINPIAGFMAVTHTHQTNGIIHVESPTTQTYTLGQFFDVWGVRLTSTCIGGYCDTASTTLKVYANGKLYEGNLRLLPFKERQEIFVDYGSKTATTTIPSSYKFAQGY